MRKYIALMLEVMAVVCLIAWVVVVTDFFWSRLPPDHHSTSVGTSHAWRAGSRPQTQKKAPPPLVGQRGEFPPLGRSAIYSVSDHDMSASV